MYSADVQTPSQQMAIEPIVGTEDATVDEKGRVRLSVKKQDRLGRNFVLLRDPVGCLMAIPQRIWRQKLGEILTRPASAIERDIELRDIGSQAEDDVNFDAQGRFVIPQRFRTDLNLTKDVVLVGAIDRVEIWSKDEYGKFSEAKAKFAKTRREMAEKGIVPTAE
jgi:MraZ protein